MNAELTQQLEACAAGSLRGSLTFPEIVLQLIALGVERYHVDYSRGEITYYLPDGAAHVVAAPHERHVTADVFSADAVAAAVGQSQRGEHTYLDFVRKTMAAGCIGYFTHITGRNVMYFGRRGEVHREPIPIP